MTTTFSTETSSDEASESSGRTNWRASCICQVLFQAFTVVVFFISFQFLQGTTLQYYVTSTVVYTKVPRPCPPMLPKPSLDMSSRHNLSHTLYYLWSILFLLFSSIRFVSFSNGAHVHENLRLIAVTYISSMKNETEVIIYWNQAYL